MHYEWLRVVGGPLETNTYLLKHGSTGLIVDPGVEPELIYHLVERAGVAKVVAVLVTHGHFDHVFYAGEVAGYYGVKVFVHAEDIWLIERSCEFAEVFYGEPCRPLSPGSVEPLYGDLELVLGEVVLKLLHTPGHTRGSMCIIAGGLLFTGDTLFKGTIGRTDLPGSAPQLMESSLRKIASLPGDYLVLPGHGEFTWLSIEKKSNPYLKNLA